MLPKPYPLHPEALRDALGFVRLLYATTKAKGDDPIRLRAVVVAGESIRKALDMVERHAPDTMGGRAASAHAVTGFQALHGVMWPEDVAQLVREAERRALGLR